MLRCLIGGVCRRLWGAGMSETCWECGAPPPVHHHHVVPRSRGGTRTVPLCEGCHARAHHRAGNMTTSATTREALAAKRARGEHTGGDIPYGYTVDEKGRLIKGEEGAVLDRILELHEHGVSRRKIVFYLNRRGVKPRGAKWHKTTIDRILKYEQRRKKAREARDHLTTPQNNAHWDSIREDVYRQIETSSGGGMTCDEVERCLGLPHQTASARIRELWQAGRIVYGEERRTTRNGKNARVYYVVEDMPPPRQVGLFNDAP
jgi:hypothetical protein